MKKNLKAKVEKILETNPKSRNDDITLQFALIKQYFPEGIFQQQDGSWWISSKASRLYRDDHISRIRALIQNKEGKFLPTDPEILKKRGIQEQEWHNFVLN